MIEDQVVTIVIFGLVVVFVVAAAAVAVVRRVKAFQRSRLRWRQRQLRRRTM